MPTGTVKIWLGSYGFITPESESVPLFHSAEMVEYHALIIGEYFEKLERLIEQHNELVSQRKSRSQMERALGDDVDNLNNAVLESGGDWQNKNVTFALLGEYFYASGCSLLKDMIKESWQSWLKTVNIRQEGYVEFYQLLDSPNFNLHLLPKPSFAFAFKFKLQKSYISGDEPQVYIIDNPIVKDRLFGMPMVKPSTWKGHLRHAMREMLEWQPGQPDREVINRLFGPLKDEAELAQGYLHFYPTFFKKVSLEVINPHNRKKRVGKVPIPFEAVPANQSGKFYLLYSPVWANACALEHAKCDLKAVARGVAAMFTLYGFSAKKTDGYGVAKERLSPAGEMPMLHTNDTQIAEELNWATHDDGTAAIERIPSFAALRVL
jgi:CRISPR/Cas system CMR subunit Cmr6 (Cas7 group RAMP superfamily)